MRIQACVALLGALLVSSCTFSRAEINDSNIPERAKTLEPGSITQEQLIEGIGSPPGQIIFMGDGRRLLIYNYGQSRTKGFTLILFNFLKTNIAVDTAIFLVEGETVVDAWVGDNSEDVPWEWYPFGD